MRYIAARSTSLFESMRSIAAAPIGDDAPLP
jgi:hypothetical protein